MTGFNPFVPQNTRTPPSLSQNHRLSCPVRNPIASRSRSSLWLWLWLSLARSLTPRAHALAQLFTHSDMKAHAIQTELQDGCRNHCNGHLFILDSCSNHECPQASHLGRQCRPGAHPDTFGYRMLDLLHGFAGCTFVYFRCRSSAFLCRYKA